MRQEAHFVHNEVFKGEVGDELVMPCSTKSGGGGTSISHSEPRLLGVARGACHS